MRATRVGRGLARFSIATPHDVHVIAIAAAGAAADVTWAGVAPVAALR